MPDIKLYLGRPAPGDLVLRGPAGTPPLPPLPDQTPRGDILLYPPAALPRDAILRNPGRLPSITCAQCCWLPGPATLTASFSNGSGWAVCLNGHSVSLSLANPNSCYPAYGGNVSSGNTCSTLWGCGYDAGLFQGWLAFIQVEFYPLGQVTPVAIAPLTGRVFTQSGFVAPINFGDALNTLCDSFFTNPPGGTCVSGLGTNVIDPTNGFPSFTTVGTCNPVYLYTGRAVIPLQRRQPPGPVFAYSCYVDLSGSADIAITTP